MPQGWTDDRPEFFHASEQVSLQEISWRPCGLLKVKTLSVGPPGQALSVTTQGQYVSVSNYSI